MSAPSRLLLDQNFPAPPHGMRFDNLDRTVTLEHFSAVFPDHAKVSTPDWMVYLLARRGGFDALVTSDHHQLGEDTEMVALEVARMGLITWKSGDADPVVLYGQLLAYMPQIVAELRAHADAIVTLPKATLRPHDHLTRPGRVLRSRHRHDGLSHRERRAAALRHMRSALMDGPDAALAELIPAR